MEDYAEAPKSCTPESTRFKQHGPCTFSQQPCLGSAGSLEQKILVYNPMDSDLNAFLHRHPFHFLDICQVICFPKHLDRVSFQ